MTGALTPTWLNRSVHCAFQVPLVSPRGRWGALAVERVFADDTCWTAGWRDVKEGERSEQVTADEAFPQAGTDAEPETLRIALAMYRRLVKTVCAPVELQGLHGIARNLRVDWDDESLRVHSGREPLPMGAIVAVCAGLKDAFDQRGIGFEWICAEGPGGKKEVRSGAVFFPHGDVEPKLFEASEWLIENRGMEWLGNDRSAVESEESVAMQPG